MTPRPPILLPPDCLQVLVDQLVLTRYHLFSKNISFHFLLDRLELVHHAQNSPATDCLAGDPAATCQVLPYNDQRSSQWPLYLESCQWLRRPCLLIRQVPWKRISSVQTGTAGGSQPGHPGIFSTLCLPVEHPD